jgi:hypothetical protein
LFNRSLDSGSTWLPTDVRLDAEPAGVVTCKQQIAADGSSLCVVWEDSRNGSEDIYCNRSLDGGSTWLDADIRLDTDSAGAARSLRPVLTVAGSVVGATWRDFRNGREDI